MIRGVVIGQEHLIPFLRQIYPRTQMMLVDSIERMTTKLARKVKYEKLHGQLLKNRSGKLWRSINNRVEKTDTSVTGIVGSNAEYAAAHEYGINRMVSQHVKAHQRNIKEAFGKPLKDGSKIVNVRSFNRAMWMHLPARPFLRSSLDEMTPEIREKIREALRKAMER